MTAYLISLIEVIQPKVVLTFIDNSLKFSDLARALDKKINFVAIQNAARYDFNKYKYRYKKKLAVQDYTKNLYIPNYLCFGKFEIDHFRKHKVKLETHFEYTLLLFRKDVAFSKKKTDRL